MLEKDETISKLEEHLSNVNAQMKDSSTQLEDLKEKYQAQSKSYKVRWYIKYVKERFEYCTGLA